MKKNRPWDQLIADSIVRYIVRTSLTPNQITIFSLFLALIGSTLFLFEHHILSSVGATLFVLARFFDHVDGELARQKNMTSKLGYYLDYVTGGISYAALFICLGIGFQNGHLGPWSMWLGIVGGISALVCVFLNLNIDNKNEAIKPEDGESIGYPQLFRFELEDGIYLIAPITWLGWLEEFYIVSGFGALVYFLWTFLISIRLSKSSHKI